VLKKFSLLISVFYTLILSALSLLKLEGVVKEISSINDKVGHALAHFIFVVLWFLVFNYKFNIKFNKALIFSALLSLVYGISIELLQGYVTVSRQNEFKDVLANILGTVFAVVLLIHVKKRMLKNINSLLF